MERDNTWEELMRAEGVDSAKLDDYINEQVRQNYGAAKRKRKPTPKRIEYPARIPTADVMLDDLDESGSEMAVVLETLLFNFWLDLQAEKQGLRQAKRKLLPREFKQRYYGDDAPDRL